jgi:hypothetical protein
MTAVRAMAATHQKLTPKAPVSRAWAATPCSRAASERLPLTPGMRCLMACWSTMARAAVPNELPTQVLYAADTFVTGQVLYEAPGITRPAPRPT